jgi:hypothetical protein
MPSASLLRSTDLSPELALVDSVLAEDARSRLPQGSDTLARLELLVRAQRLAASRGAPERHPDTQESAQSVDHRSSLPSRRWQRRGHRRTVRTAVVTGTIVAAALVSTLLIGVRVDFESTLAGTDTSGIGQPPMRGTPAKQPKPKKLAKQVDQSHARSPIQRTQEARTPPSRRFVWAPAAGATGYHVEFFRASNLIFKADSKGPEITLPLSWAFAGKLQSLAPGEYRWYVWRLGAEGRSAAALVQARLLIPSRG